MYGPHSNNLFKFTSAILPMENKAEKKGNFQWEEMDGIRSLNIELVKKRHPIKYLIENVFGDKFVRYLKFLRSRSALKESLKNKNHIFQQQKCGKVAIIFMGSQDYVKFFPRFYSTVNQNFLPETKKDFFAFTDQTDYDYFKDKSNVHVVPVKYGGPAVMTLSKFKFISSIAEKLKDYSHVVYIDSDMYARDITTEEEFFCHTKPIIAIRHPIFLNVKGQFEMNPKSRAALNKNDDLSIYRQACFWGGKTNYVIEMCKRIKEQVDQDFQNKIIATWLDESHLNKFFVRNKHLIYTHDSNYCYPWGWPVLEGYSVKFFHDKGDVLK